MTPPYAELHCVSNFSFLRGASHPEELVQRAQAQGYAALAITDECSLAGVVRAHVKAKEVGLPLLVGSEFGLHGLFGHPDDPSPVLAPRTSARRRREPGTLDTRAAPRDARAPPARLVLLAQHRAGYGNLRRDLIDLSLCRI